MATNVRDPRTMITPDAFEVSEDMLGLPLATPGKRLTAIVIDLVVIGLITVMTSDLRLIIWGIVGLFFLQMAFRAPGRKMGKASAFLFRGATGCLGMMILLGVGIGWLAIGFDSEEFAQDAIRGMADGAGDVQIPGLPEGLPEGVPGTEGSERSALSMFGDLASGLAGMAAAGQLAEVESESEARDVIFSLLDAGHDGFGMDRDQLTDMVEGLVPDDAGFTDDPAAFRARVLDEWITDRGIDFTASDEGTPSSTPSGDDSAAADSDLGDVEKEVASMSAAQVLREWALRMENGDTEGTDLRTTAIRARAIALVAGDSLQTLGRSNGRLRSQLDDSRTEVSTLQTALDEGEGGMTGLLREIWEQLGSAFGLWSIYFTVMLSLFKGRTVGKMFTRTRVVRLDGQPINWWAAFERCGGYFAGIATGLLGFAQVYWDPNRQCVHDKIVGTAVVLDGVKAVPGAWREAAGHGDDATTA